MTIFFITVLFVDENKVVQRTRTWCWYQKLGMAQDRVLINATDMFERGYYNLAVIEEITEGLLPDCISSWWYEAIVSDSPNAYFGVEVRPISKQKSSPDIKFLDGKSVFMWASIG